MDQRNVYMHKNTSKENGNEMNSVDKALLNYIGFWNLLGEHLLILFCVEIAARAKAAMK